MCSPVTCKKCSKTTWSGCGEHIEYALQGVAQKDRCTCQESSDTNSGFFSKMFGK